MKVIYEHNSVCSPEEVSDVFKASGIRRPIDDLDRLTRMISNANETVTARVDGELVGILRAITDYSYCCYISDIAVNKAYQGLGIGKDLIERLINKLGNDEVQYVLTSAPQAEGFYERLGFERNMRSFVVRRKIN
ncbi:N-acetyltransferase GCN5 [Paenibacillus montaniterrae]|uniref:N-acetyltransferase GCN5 n=1 Tax=Paenibacillus montaniterrae TaxID=429341 RepID=A0A920CYK7_9BACL|nr:GNAT family N-acetyltransferase [Paenibacillus montaniterrae]GIP17510.1 N-acetyltransferase GCN5 [Paenibacillus montaniterrae]